MMPFKTIPQLMTINLVKTVAFYVNDFTLKVSEYLSPMTLVEGVQLDFNKHFQVTFGAYTHTFEGSSNSMKEHTV